MIDWNGDGKVDPAEVGATMVFLDDDNQPPVKKKQPSGCFASCLVVLAVFSVLCGVCSFRFLFFRRSLCLSYKQYPIRKRWYLNNASFFRRLLIGILF